MSITYLEAIREAQAKLLRDDKRVFIYGQEVGGRFGGAFKATKGLAKEFPGRVLNTPISEDAMVGTAIGAALEGMRPIVEMQFADFSIIALTGRDLTIVSYSAMLHESLRAAEEIAKEGFEIEVVDLRTVKPLDTATVVASVARTGRLLAVGESFPWGGVTAEVIARVSTEGFHLLDAAPARINAKDTPIPYHPNLWSTHRPSSKMIAAKARQLLRE